MFDVGRHSVSFGFRAWTELRSVGVRWAGAGGRARSPRSLAYGTAGVATVALLAAGLAGSARSAPSLARAAASAQAITVYAVPAQFQYDDFSDDRARGQGRNPFGNYTAPHSQLPVNELYYGPFAGDMVFIAYNLFTSPGLATSAGSAVLVCQFNLAKVAFCSASYGLKDGAVVGFGAFPFHATAFTLGVTGGTSAYASSKGEVAASLSTAARAKATPMFANPTSLAVEPQKLTFSLASQAAAKRSQTIDVYAFPDSQQYLDHNDDEARGTQNNPFGPRLYPQCLSLPHPQKVACDAAATRADSAKIDEHNNGPFAGDQSVFSFEVYASPARSKQTGTAALTCQYYFDKNGFCTESIQLKDGTIYAAGTFNFEATQFTLPVTGGTGTYAGLTGQVQESPGGNHTEHLAFSLS